MDHVLNNSEKPIPTAEDVDEDEEEGGDQAVKSLEGEEAKVRSLSFQAIFSTSNEEIY